MNETGNEKGEMTDQLDKKTASMESQDMERQQTEAQSVEKAEDPWTDTVGDDSANKPNEKPQPSKSPASKDKESENEPEKDEEWQKDLLNRLAFSAINEQRRTRRWGIFFKMVFVVYIFGIFAMYYFPKGESNLHLGPHTAFINLSGPIAEGAAANADNIVGGLRSAFKDKNTKAVILRINSPGGSPVQAGYINDEMFRLREKYPNIPLYAVVSDVCASAAYYIASGATEIYADKGSIVGSIGVLMDSYGFVGTLDKLGVERRLITAGENKGFLDPFSPLKPDDKAFMEGMLSEVHQQFIDVVKKGRGDKLVDDPVLFSGLFWSGEKSVELGLVDGLGSSSYVAREIVGEEKLVDFTPRPNYLDRFAERIGVSAANAISSMFMNPGEMR